jgi:hypothetical protein
MWGVPGNIMQITVRVRSSTDPQCRFGTVGGVVLFASYNGVRSDSVQFTFPPSCKGHTHLYHGPQVNNQVPPLWFLADLSGCSCGSSRRRAPTPRGG